MVFVEFEICLIIKNIYIYFFHRITQMNRKAILLIGLLTGFTRNLALRTLANMP